MPLRLTFVWIACLALAVPVAAQQGRPALIILDVEEEGAEITFDTPLQTGDPAISGRSIAELAAGKPLFPPIEGLPEAVWGGKSCSGCHNWDRTTLCEQGQFYLSEAGKVGLAKVHPYGGGFKQALRTWSAQGCK